MVNSNETIDLKLNDSLTINKNKINKIDINELKFRDYIFTSMCKSNFTDQIAAVARDQNEILLFDLQYDYIKSIKKVADIDIFNPQCIFNYNDNFYLTQLNNHQLLIIDKEFKRVKRQIRKDGETNSSNYPIDIFVNNNAIYMLVLHQNNHLRLQVFNLEGDFMREIELSKTYPQTPAILNDNLNLKWKIKAYNDIFVVYSLSNDNNFKSKVHIFDLEGKLKHILVIANLCDLCFINNFILTHSNDGFIGFYAAKKQTQFEKYFYQLAFKLKFEKLNSKSSLITFLNDTIVVFIENENLLVNLNLIS